MTVRVCLRCQSVISMSLQGFFHLCSHENVDFSSTGKPLYLILLFTLYFTLHTKIISADFGQKCLKSNRDISMKNMLYILCVHDDLIQ